MSATATVRNADLWRVVFTDAEGAPVDPDGPVTWTVRTLRDVKEVVQEVGSAAHTGPGTFELLHTPQIVASYRVKAYATVGGIAQATPEIARGVEP